MGTFQSFRRAYGALKDSTMVGLSKVNSDFKDLDIAIVKATNHVECPPKERHVRTTSVVRLRAEVVYCIHALSKRLSQTKNWVVYYETSQLICKAEESEPAEGKKQAQNNEDNKPPVETEEEPQPKEEVAEPLPSVSTDNIGDLLGLNELNPRAAEIEESNALALAIVQPGQSDNLVMDSSQFFCR